MSRQKIIGCIGLKFNTVAMRQVSNYHRWRSRPVLDCMLKVPRNSTVSQRGKQKSAAWLNSDSVAVTEIWDGITEKGVCIFWFMDLEVIMLSLRLYTLEINNNQLCVGFSWRFLLFIPAEPSFPFFLASYALAFPKRFSKWNWISQVRSSRGTTETNDF